VIVPLRDDNPVERVPVVTYALLAANVLAFAWQLGLPGVLHAPAILDAMRAHFAVSVHRGGLVPYELLTLSDIEYRDIVPPPFTVLTSMFLHGSPDGTLLSSLGHIGFNLLFLWIFGNNVEDALGRLRFLTFYLLCGVAAALVQVAASAVTGLLLVPMVGASGAIAGVLAAYMLLYPRARVVTLVVIVVLPIPAGLFIGVWFAGQLLSVLYGANTGVAFFAHIGGFVAGLGLLQVLGRRPGWTRRRAYG
jgi:membrane associated rhomboid family serine protease